MSKQKRGIMLKSLNHGDEGMQELINPVPLSMVVADDNDADASADINLMIEQENRAVKDVIDMLEDTAILLSKK